MKNRTKIAWLYPDLMSTYGDRGNVIVLRKRCEWRGIKAEIVPVTLETRLSTLENCDIIFMGGAQDRQQKLASADFLKHKGPIVRKMVEHGTPALFVCAAYQFVGHFYKPYRGDKIPGAGIFDLYTEHPGDQAKRLIGNVVAEIVNPHELQGTIMVGFENHGGRTHLGPKMLPLARVIKGFGNNGEDGFEGAIYKNAIGSYFHGPLLPKNPAIADWLLEKVLGSLKPLDDTLEHQANQAAR
jgi:CobQ-like glutamine amidotransferase family enzyme